MKFIWIGRRPLENDVQMDIFIFDSMLVEAVPIDRMCGHLLNKDCKKLNEFLDKYSDAQPFGIHRNETQERRRDIRKSEKVD